MRGRIGRRFRVVGVVLLLAVQVAAETPAADRALAEALFQQGRELMDGGDAEGACAKFAESYRLDSALGTLVNLAACHEAQGHLATAWAEYNHAIALARRRGDDERLEFAKAGSERLGDKVPRLRIRLTPPSEPIDDMTFTIGERRLGRAGLDTPLPVDPGVHQVTVRVPGYQPETQTVNVSRNSGEVVVEVGPLTPTGKKILPAPQRFKAAKSNEVSSEERGTSWDQRTWGFVLGAVGVGSLVVGGAFGLRALQKKNERDGLCTGGVCDSRAGIDAHDAAADAARVANVASAAGFVLTSTSAILVLTQPDRKQSALRVLGHPIQAGGWLGLERAW